MAMINCPECNKELSESAVTCVNCGHRLKAVSNKTRNLIIAIVAGVILTVLLGYGVYNQQQEEMQAEHFQQQFDNYKSKYDEAMAKWNETYDKEYLDDAEYYLDKMKEMTGQE